MEYEKRGQEIPHCSTYRYFCRFFLDDSETWGLFSSTVEVSGFLDSKLPDYNNPVTGLLVPYYSQNYVTLSKQQF